MTSKRPGLLGGSILAGALFLGTAGLVAAQGPTASPSASANTSGWTGMMGGSGMMSGSDVGMTGSSGMGQMDADDIQVMTALHQSMAANGTFDHAKMTQLHAQMHESR